MILKILKLAEDVQKIDLNCSSSIKKIASKINRRKKHLLIDILEIESIVSKDRAEPINSEDLIPNIEVKL
tara:strand:+ start:9 stop:218 length:210 start_codon:yes stop_codon:yes gene_type:complete